MNNNLSNDEYPKIRTATSSQCGRAQSCRFLRHRAFLLFFPAATPHAHLLITPVDAARSIHGRAGPIILLIIIFFFI